MHQSKNLQPQRLPTTVKLSATEEGTGQAIPKQSMKTSQYRPSATLQTARFSSWHKGKLSSFALVFPSSEYPAFLLLNICEGPCFYYFSSLMDSTLLSIREATRWQPQRRGARRLGPQLAAAAIRAHGT